MRDKVLGGVPKNPEVIEMWLRSKMGLTDLEEVRTMMFRTLEELGAEVTPDMSYEAMIKVSKSMANTLQTNGFKVNEQGIYTESRQVKAMLKEAVNVLYGAVGERWGPSRKGPKGFTAERVFIEPDELNLGRKEADGVEFLIVHAQTPQGPRSSLAYHEFARWVSFSFEIEVLRDELPREKWPVIWEYAERNGFGACRSQGFGKFAVTKWEQV